MARTFREILLGGGAVMHGETERPIHFGSPAAELAAARRLCVLADRSEFGRILGTGPDLLDLLNRLSTADLSRLSPGEGRPTVLTTPKGRIVERLFVHRLAGGELLLCAGPGGTSRTLEHLQHFTFAENTGLSDIDGETVLLAVTGPLSSEALAAAGFDRPEPYGSTTEDFEGSSVHLLGQDGLDRRGVSILVPREKAGSLWQTLVLAVAHHDGRAAGEEALEAYRIVEGIPLGGRELTGDHNPLEAGLLDAISFEKGCYVGQEVVARLRTYDKVSRALFGIVGLPGTPVPEPGTALFHDGREAGRITSATLLPGADLPLGLAYVKPRVAGAGATVQIGASDATRTGRLVETPIELEGSAG